MQKEIEKTAKASGLFEHFSLGSEKQDLYLDLTFSSGGNVGLGAFLGAVSGASLFLVPVYVTDPWILKVDVYERGKIVKTYEYKDEMRTWIHLTMLLVFPFHTTESTAIKTLNNMTANFLRDFERDRKDFRAASRSAEVTP